MGNNPSNRRRSSEEEENAGRSFSGGTNPKKKLIVQPSQEYQGEDAITKILHQTSLNDGPTRSRTARLSYSESTTTNSSLGTYNMNPKTLPTVFKWEGGGKEVFISGTFNGWRAKIPMVKSNHNFYTIIDLPEGEHQYKFIVDNQWKVDHNQGLSPTVGGNPFTQNNLLEVKPSDFDVIEALSHDMAHSKTSQTQQQHHSASAGPPSRRQRTLSVDSGDDPKNTIGIPPHLKDQPAPTTPLGFPTGSSPPGEYTQEEPHVSFLEEVGTSKQQNPPLLPPQLLQVILNKNTGAQCDPNLLPHPNHVMVNHMYALSIKDGVIVLSAITRYRKKFVSTVIYKPI
jgi:5'-AMP-activated protein kinase, regulatory beta subunit